MKNYNIVADNENEKYTIMNLIRAAGAKITGVSGYYSGYYIQFDATSDQAANINTKLQEVFA
jgi:hypothetical protein